MLERIIHQCSKKSCTITHRAFKQNVTKTPTSLHTKKQRHIYLCNNAPGRPHVTGKGPAQLQGHFGAAVLSGIYDARLARVVVVRRPSEINYCEEGRRNETATLDNRLWL